MRAVGFQQRWRAQAHREMVFGLCGGSIREGWGQDGDMRVVGCRWATRFCTLHHQVGCSQVRQEGEKVRTLDQITLQTEALEGRFLHVAQFRSADWSFECNCSTNSTSWTLMLYDPPRSALVVCSRSPALARAIE